MEIGMYSSKHDALKAITIAYLSSIGFFDITKENFSVSNAYTWQIKDTLRRYSQFMDVVIDTLESENDEQGFYIACYEQGYSLMEDTPEAASRFNLDSFVYLTSDKYIHSKKPASFFHYKFEEHHGYIVEILLAHEMKKIVCEYTETFSALCK